MSLPASLRARLAQLSMKDDEFRKAFVADPMNTVRRHFALPEGGSLRVVEVDPATTCILIPRRPPEWPSDMSASDAVARLKKVLTPLSHGVPAIAEAVLGLIARAMVDQRYAEGLISSPKSVMREAGINVPDGVDVMVAQETGSESVVIIPSKQPSVVITDDDLDATAILLRDSLVQADMTTGSWPFKCSNPDTWCPTCLKELPA
jgi:hypothetical protein